MLSRGRTSVVSAAGVLVVLAAVGFTLGRSPHETVVARVETVSAPAAPSAPAPAPADEGPAVDPTSYDLAALPSVDVFSVLPELPLDPAPDLPPTQVLVTPTGEAAPVFAEPGSPPVARLASEQVHDGTTVPVVEQHEHWLRVLLPGRQGYPSAGSPVRRQDGSVPPTSPRRPTRSS